MGGSFTIFAALKRCNLCPRAVNPNPVADGTGVSEEGDCRRCQLRDIHLTLAMILGNM
jgi:hypothetical protein